MKYTNIFYTSILVSTSFWFTESLLHYLIFDAGHGFDIIPHDANEFWMRSFICVLIIIFGFYAHTMVRRCIQHEQERLETLKATMSTVQDVVGNSFNQLQLLLFELEQKDPDKKELYDKYNSIIKETSKEINKIADVEVIQIIESPSGMKKLDF